MQPIDKLTELHGLYTQGALTEAEYEQMKRKLFAPASPSSDIILEPIRRFSDFDGRSGTKEYWIFQLLYTLLIIAAWFLFPSIVDIGPLKLLRIATDDFNIYVFVMLKLSDLPGPMMAIIGSTLLMSLIGLLVPLIALQVRRFHDQNRSGLYALLNLIPYIGWSIVLIFMLIDGTEGDNRYGPDPKDRI